MRKPQLLEEIEQHYHDHSHKLYEDKFFHLNLELIH